ncbi:transaldolase family protein [Vasconcelosia minhoensis]|nr:transaldolase family protein [Romeria gracilis]
MPNFPPPRLRLCLDTADASAWQTWLPIGLFYGVTCNPLLLEQAGVPCTVATLITLAEQAFDLGAKEIQIQTWGDSTADLVETGERLAAIDRRVVVKIPITREGTTAAAQLISRGARVTLTAVYAVHQVLIAAALGAEYVAPYLGRITDDQGRDGRADLAAMQQALSGVDSSTRILTASIRQIEDIVFLAQQGLDTFTVSAAIAAAFFDVAATQSATEDFERAARKMSSLP